MSLADTIRAVPSKLPKISGAGPRLARTGAIAGVVIVAATLFVALFFIWSRMQLVQIGYEISALQKTNESLAKRKRELMLELSSLESPDVLERKAREKVGLVFPPMGRVVHVP